MRLWLATSVSSPARSPDTALSASASVTTTTSSFSSSHNRWRSADTFCIPSSPKTLASSVLGLGLRVKQGTDSTGSRRPRGRSHSSRDIPRARPGGDVPVFLGRASGTKPRLPSRDASGIRAPEGRRWQRPATQTHVVAIPMSIVADEILEKLELASLLSAYGVTVRVLRPTEAHPSLRDDLKHGLIVRGFTPVHCPRQRPVKVPADPDARSRTTVS